MIPDTVLPWRGASVTARALHHERGCESVDLEHFTGRRGDALVKCRGCGRLALAPEDAPVAPTPHRTPVAPPVARVAASEYVCRDHGVPVSWRGTGCPSCVAEHQQRVAQRARDRAGRLARAAARAAR